MLPVIAHHYGGCWSPKRDRNKVKDRQPGRSSPPHILAFLAIQFSKNMYRRVLPTTQKSTGAEIPFQGRHRTREARKPQAFSALLLFQEVRYAPAQENCAGPRSVARGLLPVNPVPDVFSARTACVHCRNRDVTQLPGRWVLRTSFNFPRRGREGYTAFGSRQRVS